MKKFLMCAALVGSFSLMGANYAEAGSGCYCPAPAVATAQAPGVQRYSYVPGAAPRAAYAPMRRMSPSRTPSYLLPKTDPRKFSGF